MTIDIAIWKQGGRLSDAAAYAEFERRFEDSDPRFPNYREPVAELTRLADLLEAAFPDPPWEDLRDSLDGEFVYLTIGSDGYQEVEDFLAAEAPKLGLLVFSPLSESVVAQS
ncbi:hypothetical protein [Marmoricola sp. URHB0036]|uniref:hypothetical protein n=1 Tax=Marmoricola sp. URHB0036 TaxID=1298863 RepID=UPI00041B9139|nr:hypothetical protein [Marmoricola sp. URHB0036]